jgi:hypothetical protein
MPTHDLKRPYLVIAKLIEQPTWGSSYIVEAKGWSSRGALGSAKIGQSYELFSGSNLSLLDSSEDPAFAGELTDRTSVQEQTYPEHSVPLRNLLAASPEEVLGAGVIARRGSELNLLAKFTQALGNSFQVHIKAGLMHPTWKPKPESWYYFEPGLITIGAKPGIDWADYESAVTAVQDAMAVIGQRVKSGDISYEAAREQVGLVLAGHDPWRYVNTLEVAAGELVDLSGGGLHHSWEEDSRRAPLGNVLYELQSEALDDISTFRSFDKGKMGSDGSIRNVHIKEYFQFIDRTPEANDPKTHIRAARLRSSSDTYRLEALLETPYYSLDRLTLAKSGATFTESLQSFKHLFMRSGSAQITAGGHAITVTAAHSCLVPAATEGFTARALSAATEILISF